MRYRKPRGSLIAHSASKKVGSDSASKLQTRSARQLTSNSALWLLALAARLHPECEGEGVSPKPEAKRHAS